MKAALTMILGLMIFLSQTASPVCPATPLNGSCCSKCRCADKSCCYGQSSRGTPADPAAPVPQVSTEQLQIVIHEALAITAIDATPISQPVPNSVVFSGSTAVPLYFRNCSLLI